MAPKFLEQIAQENEAFLAEGSYTSPSGIKVDLAVPLKNVLENSVLYRPEQYGALIAPAMTPRNTNTIFEVANETTTSGLDSLVSRYETEPVALNFASGRHPGGGYLEGSRAQEEDLCRCSALYRVLLQFPRYFESNRQSSGMYSDHMIYAPSVPFFRKDNYELRDSCLLASVISAPAPNAAALQIPQQDPKLEFIFFRRAKMVLSVAEKHGHRHLVLGAWGCGVFGNSPSIVANIFKGLLTGDRFRNVFEHVRFSVLDRTPDQGTFEAFRREFA